MLGVEESEGARAGREPRKEAPLRRGRSETLIDAGRSGKEQALDLVAEGARGLPIYYPRMLAARSGFSTASPRAYVVRAPGGRRFRSYRIVMKRDDPGEYYGLQGTTWMDPPILRSPSEVREYKGRRFELHYDGDRLRLVAWRTGDAVYWVSNTLLQTLSEKQMLEIARGARAL